MRSVLQEKLSSMEDKRFSMKKNFQVENKVNTLKVQLKK